MFDNESYTERIKRYEEDENKITVEEYYNDVNNFRKEFWENNKIQKPYKPIEINDCEYICNYVRYIFSLYINNDYSNIYKSLFEGNTCSCGDYEECSKFIDEASLPLDEYSEKLLNGLTMYCNGDKESESKVISKVIRSWMWYLDKEYLDDELEFKDFFGLIDRSKYQCNKRIRITIDPLIWEKFVKICDNHKINICVMFRNGLHRFMKEKGSVI